MEIAAIDDGIQRAGKAGKKLIPWRDIQRGPLLKLSLVKLVVVTGLHLLKGTVGIDDKWRLLMGDLLRQPEWNFLDVSTMAPLEPKIFKEQFNTIVDDVCKTQGWGPYGGTSGNLSGKEGEMDELTLQVRQILLDLEKKKEDKESQKALQESLNSNEMHVLMGAIAKASKAKRALESSSSSSSCNQPGTSTPSPSSTFSVTTPLTELQQLDAYLSTGRVPKKSRSLVSGVPRDHMALKDKIMKELKNFPERHFVVRCNVIDVEPLELLEELGLELVVSLFAEAADPTISTEFRNNMKEMGFPARDAMKIFLVLIRIYKDLHKDGGTGDFIASSPDGVPK